MTAGYNTSTNVGGVKTSFGRATDAIHKANTDTIVVVLGGDYVNASSNVQTTFSGLPAGIHQLRVREVITGSLVGLWENRKTPQQQSGN